MVILAFLRVGMMSSMRVWGFSMVVVSMWWFCRILIRVGLSRVGVGVESTMMPWMVFCSWCVFGLLMCSAPYCTVYYYLLRHSHDRIPNLKPY